MKGTVSGDRMVEMNGREKRVVIQYFIVFMYYFISSSEYCNSYVMFSPKK